MRQHRFISVEAIELPRPAKPAAWAAEILGCDLSRIYKLLKNGSLEGYRDGRSVRVFIDSVVTYQGADPIKKPQKAVQKERRRERNSRFLLATERLRGLGINVTIPGTEGGR